MIELYCGLIGSGKTLHAVRRGLEYLASGGIVYSNVGIHPEAVCRYLKARHGVECAVDDVSSRWRIISEEGCATFYKEITQGVQGKPTLIIIDEAVEWFDTLFKEKDLLEFTSFLRQSRKVFIDCIFIAQAKELLNKRLRLLCEWIHNCIDFSRWKCPGLPWLTFRWVPFFLVQQKDKTGKYVVKPRWYRKDGLLYKCYDTYQLYRKLDIPTSTIEPARVMPQKVSHLPLVLSVCSLLGVAGLWYYKPIQVQPKTQEAVAGEAKKEKEAVEVRQPKIESVLGVYKGFGVSRGVVTLNIDNVLIPASLPCSYGIIVFQSPDLVVCKKGIDTFLLWRMEKPVIQKPVADAKHTGQEKTKDS